MAQKPDALARLLVHERAVEMLLEGLRIEYVACAASGRIQEWCDTAQALVTLIRNCAEPVHKHPAAALSPPPDRAGGAA